MTDLRRITELVFARPHHIEPSAGETIAAVLERRVRLGEDLALGGADRPAPEAHAFVGTWARDADGRPQGYRVAKSHVAIVDLKGELINRGAWLGASSGLVSYEGLRQTVGNIRKNRTIRSVLIDVDSPGGMATGMIETAQLVRALAQQLPVIAVANGRMCSAAYGVCSGATRIIATPTSEVGSIGTLLMHLDRSGELAQKGWAVTFIHAGAHKVDGNSFQPLPPAVRERPQAQVEKLQLMFVAAVAAGRRMTAKKVRATEARVFLGTDAVKAGLVDAVGSFEQALVALARRPPGPVASQSTTQGLAAIHRRQIADSEKSAAVQFAARNRFVEGLIADARKGRRS